MTLNARAAVLRAKGGAFQIEDVEVTGAGPGELAVAVKGSGLCHTDIIVRDGFRNVATPVVLGHEGAGTVVEIGDGVAGFEVGDTVVLGFPFCGSCVECITGRPYNCPELDHRWYRCQRDDGSHPFQNHGSPIRGFFAGQSSFSSHTVIAAHQAVKVAEGLDPIGLGPLACGISTGAGGVLNVLRPRPGSSIVVYGLGAVGLSAVMAARLCGCSTIIGVDRVPARLDLASDLGATITLDASDESVVEKIRKVSNGGTDFAIEATGVPSVVVGAVLSLRGGGEALYVGNHPEDATFDLPAGGLEENQGLRGSALGHTVPRQFIPFLARLHLEGRFPFDRMLRFYSLSDFEQALGDVAQGVTIKPVIAMPGAC